MPMNTFRRNFEFLIKSNGLLLREAGEKIGKSEANVSRYLSGVRKPEIETIIAIAEAFDVSLDWLFGLSDDANITVSEDAAKVASLYSIASKDDQRIIDLILDKYQRG